MIKFYLHQTKKEKAWVSCHDTARLWPSDVLPRGWTTASFIDNVMSLPEANQYFEPLVWHEDLRADTTSYYVMHMGNSKVMCEHYGLASLSPTVRDQINQGVLNLLLVYTMETFDGATSLSSWQEQFCCFLTEAGFGFDRPNSVTVLLNTQSKFIDRHRDPRVRWIYYPFLELCVQNQFRRKHMWMQLAEPGQRHYKFLHLVRTPRPHRQLMAMYLEYLGCVHRGLCTWPEDQSISLRYDDLANIYNIGLRHERDFHRFLYSNRSLSSRYQNSNQGSADWLDVADYYSQCEIELVDETHQAIGDAIFLTEKTFRPLALGIPFVYLGNPGSLALIRQLGYQTFPELMDESHDHNVFPLEPILSVGRSIQQYCDNGRNVWNEPGVIEKVHHNQRVFFGRNHAKILHDALV